MEIRHQLLIIIALILNMCSSQQDHPGSAGSIENYRQILYDRNQPVDLFLHQVINHYSIPSIAVGIADTQSIQLLETVGFLNQYTEEQVDSNSTYCIGSCAKSMTATMIARLVEEGKIGWDTPIWELISTIGQDIHPENRTLTVKHLLTHTAGIEPLVTDEDFFQFSTTLDTTHRSITEQRMSYCLSTLQSPPTSAIGEFKYSNGGYIIAAAIAELISGNSWENLMYEYLFEPLELKSAYIGPPNPSIHQGVYRHYSRNDEGDPAPLASGERVIPPILYPSGFISLSPEDFLRYAQTHLRGLSGNNHFLSQGTWALLHDPIDGNSTMSYSMGWNIINNSNKKLSTHSGSDGSLYAIISIDKTAGVAGIVMCNMGDTQASSACANVMLEVMP